MEVLENDYYSKVIPNIQRWLKDERQRERAKVEISRINYDDEEELLKKGEWLTDEEFKELYSFGLKEILSLLDKYKEDHRYESDYELDWDREDAEWFMSVLITLLHFVIGGQRRQVVLQMTMEDFKKDKEGQVWCKVGMEKKLRLQAKDGVFIPNYIAEILDYYMMTIRPYLNPKKHVIALWINRNGLPLGKFYLDPKIK